MKKIIIAFILNIVFISFAARYFPASAHVVSESATLYNDSDKNSYDQRVYILKNYLRSHNSPLSEHAKDFVLCADKYDLDWRFVPAITGVESTFGKRIPPNSHNAYGWANGHYRFDSWEDSIDHVSRVLKEKYIDNGATSLNQIARIYAPPSSSWAWKVNFFMQKIDNLPLQYELYPTLLGYNINYKPRWRNWQTRRI